MSNHTTIKAIRLVAGVISLALSAMMNAGQAPSIKYAAGASQIIITDLGLLPGGTTSAGLAINSQPIIVGLATDSNLNLQRPFWDANTGEIVGFADNFNPASTAIPEHMNESRAMGGTEVYGDNVYQGIYWNSTGQAFVLPPLAGVDPFYGALHTKAHGINSQGQLAGAGKEGEPNFYTHAALWPNKDTKAIDLGFLGQGNPLNYSEAYGVNDLSHVVGNSAIGSFIHGFLWRSGQMSDLGTLSGQVVSQASAINNTGLIAGKSNIFPVVWEYDIANPNDAPRIQQLPIPAGFFSATTTAVNDSGDVVGYAGSPNIDSHAVLWRNGMAIDLGVWPGGHYSVANGINNRGQIVGTGTVAGDNLDHALMWTVDAQALTVNAFVVRQTCVNGNIVQVTLSATVQPKQPAKYRWDFTNNGTFDTALTSIAKVTHNYPDEQRITARVRAVDANGKVAFDTVTFTTKRCTGGGG
jgi:probable HAF family extracellular repeat protein